MNTFVLYFKVLSLLYVKLCANIAVDNADLRAICGLFQNRIKSKRRILLESKTCLAHVIKLLTIKRSHFRSRRKIEIQRIITMKWKSLFCLELELFAIITFKTKK